MPKRTNEFQTLIALIEQQLASAGSTIVTESEMLEDRLTGECREVDVCIRAQIHGKPITLALECRDHRRKADQIWIDGLIGKYRNLPVDKVIAVARAGFTKTAAAGAAKANIETLSLEQATAANWHLIAELPSEAVIVAHFPQVEEVVLHFVKGQVPIAAPSTMDVRLRLGEQEAPLTTIVERYATSPQVTERAFSNDTLPGFPLRIEVPDGTLIVLRSGETRFLEAIEILISITRDKSDTPFDRRVYGEAGVAYASKTYMGAQVLFSMLHQDGQTSVAATIKAPDGKTASIVSMKTEWPGPNKP